MIITFKRCIFQQLCMIKALKWRDWIRMLGFNLHPVFMKKLSNIIEYWIYNGCILWQIWSRLKMCENPYPAFSISYEPYPVLGVRLLHFDFQIHLGVAKQLIETWMEKFKCVKLVKCIACISSFPWLFILRPQPLLNVIDKLAWSSSLLAKIHYFNELCQGIFRRFA